MKWTNTTLGQSVIPTGRSLSVCNQYEIVMQKLTRALGMLSKVRPYVAKTELKSMYNAFLNPIYDMVVNFAVSMQFANCRR